VLEDHTDSTPSAVITRLCVIDSETQTVQIIVSGGASSFFAKPCFSSDGAYLAWQQWSHPDMPWDGAQIVVASVSLTAGKFALGDAKIVAGEPGKISAGYPMWSSPSLLLFTCDVSGYVNPWSYDLKTQKAGPVLKNPVEEDFDSTMWYLGWSFGAPLDKQGNTALYTAFYQGYNVLYVVNLLNGTLKRIDCPYVTVEYVHPVTDQSIVFSGGRTDDSRQIVLCTLKDGADPEFTVIKNQDTSESSFDRQWFSQPRSITLTIPETGQPFYVAYYPPTNPDYVGPADEKPPCVFYAHGGPTSYAPQALKLTVQLFTSRGFAW
jgi:dipeptidyl aminopeptidase/acylaminoacyl peptidase